MKDLYRCLDDYPPLLLQVIAQGWQLPLIEGEPREQAHDLAERMLTSSAIGRVLDRLSPGAREALAAIVQASGAVPTHRLALRFGAIRRYGPARLEREQPWLAPENALEELYYRGLLYRVYGAVGEYYGELYIVPDPLRSELPPLAAESPIAQARAIEPPNTVRRDGLALMEDLFLVLVRVRSAHMPFPTGLVPPGRAPAFFADLRLDPRLQGEDCEERLGLLWRLLQRLHLVQQDQGMVQTSLKAREWLRLTDAQRMRTLFLAWRDDPQWDELRLVPWLHCEETGWKNNPVEARRNVLAALSVYPSERWFDLQDLIRFFKEHQPDWMRPDGDFDSWYIRDAQTGQYLTGFESWDGIEAAVLRHMFASALHWLGVVELGFEAGAIRPGAFRIGEQGARLLAGGEGAAVEMDERPVAAAEIDADLTVRISPTDSLYERYQLERFADWQAQGAQVVYQIREESILRAYNAGITNDQILRFLGRIAQDQVPPSVERILLAWGGHMGQVTIKRTLVLEVADEQIMQQLKDQREIQALLGEMLSPTRCLIEEQDLDRLTELMRALGTWPKVETASSPS
ncbi:MAG: helicase-associated domain-containing protein [Anaerolineae bacterium]|nr:helicase-associated domain-containing protein [Anaerolineae bacterium]